MYHFRARAILILTFQTEHPVDKKTRKAGTKDQIVLIILSKDVYTKGTTYLMTNMLQNLQNAELEVEFNHSVTNFSPILAK